MRVYTTRLFFVLAFAVLLQHSFAQVRTLGAWKMYLPYGTSYGACDAGTKVYVAGSKGIFSYEKSSGIIIRGARFHHVSSAC